MCFKFAVNDSLFLILANNKSTAEKKSEINLADPTLGIIDLGSNLSTLKHICQNKLVVTRLHERHTAVAMV